LKNISPCTILSITACFFIVSTVVAEPHLSGHWKAQNAKYFTPSIAQMSGLSKSISNFKIASTILQRDKFFVIELAATAKEKLFIDPGESVKDMRSNDKRYCVLSYDNKTFYCTDRNESITSYGRIINKNKFYLTNLESGVMHRSPHLWYATFNREK
jgi:hypothetical protein